MDKLYTVYDSKMEAYLPPFLAKMKGHAIRMFSDTIAQPDSQFAKHPEDYTLVELGDWNEFTGVLTPYKSPVLIGSATEFCRSAEVSSISKKGA